MGATRLYICPTCFTTSDQPAACHEHAMLSCDVGQPGDGCRRPVEDGSGRLLSRAPRWFLEATGRMRACPPSTSLRH